MKEQKFEIKYIEAVFPHVENIAEFIIQSEYRVLPFEIETAMTNGKWAVYGDDIKKERQVQSFIREKMKVSFTIRQEIKYQLAEIADYASILTDDGQTLVIYNIEMNYTELSDKVWLVEMTFFVNKPNEISSNCESNYIFSTGNYNRIAVRVNNPTYEIFSIRGATTGNGFKITIPNEKEYSTLQVGNIFYWHSDISWVLAEKEKIGRAIILSKDASDIVIELYFSGVVPVIISDEIFRFVLNNIPDVVEVSTSIGTMTFNIYTKFQPKYKFSIEIAEELKDGEFMTEASLLSHKRRLNTLFYISEEELWKIKYLPFGSSIVFYDRKNNKTYTIIERSNFFTISERTDIIDLYEVELNAVINNIVSRV